MNFANKIDKRYLINGLLPSLKLLANDTPDVKKALLNQFSPLIQLINEQFGHEGYQKTVEAIVPLLDQLLYDQKEEIRDKAIEVVVALRNVVEQDVNDYIMQLTLRMAHDDHEQYRVSALKMLNELSPDMGQLICESYIVPEIKSLAIDEQSIVRVTVARNLLNVSKNVSLDYFSQQIFPLYKMLTKDDEERVRKTCADVVADIANVSPLDRNA